MQTRIQYSVSILAVLLVKWGAERSGLREFYKYKHKYIYV